MDFESNALYEALGIEAPAESENPGNSPDDSNLESTDTNEQQEQDVEEVEESHEEERADDSSSSVSDVQPNSADREKELYDASLTAAFMGRKNPFTGKPILNKADYDEYVKAVNEQTATEEREKAESKAKESGIDPETLQAVLSNTAFGKQMERSAQITERIAREQRNKAINELISKDIEQIHKYDESVTDVASLLKTKKGEEIKSLVSSGRLTYLQAFKTVYFDEIATARTKAAKQSALNQSASKEHLQSTAQRGSGESEIPTDLVTGAENMGISDMDEINKYYQNYIKSTRRQTK